MELDTTEINQNGSLIFASRIKQELLFVDSVTTVTDSVN